MCTHNILEKENFSFPERSIRGKPWNEHTNDIQNIFNAINFYLLFQLWCFGKPQVESK